MNREENHDKCDFLLPSYKDTRIFTAGPRRNGSSRNVRVRNNAQIAYNHAQCVVFGHDSGAEFKGRLSSLREYKLRPRFINKSMSRWNFFPYEAHVHFLPWTRVNNFADIFVFLDDEFRVKRNTRFLKVRIVSKS